MQEKIRLQHLESCTGVWVGKSPPFSFGSRKVICNIWSNALEFEWVRLTPSNGQDKCRLQHLELCSGVRVSETLPLLKGRSKVVCNMKSHAHDFEWVELPPFYWAG